MAKRRKTRKVPSRRRAPARRRAPTRSTFDWTPLVLGGLVGATALAIYFNQNSSALTVSSTNSTPSTGSTGSTTPTSSATGTPSSPVSEDPINEGITNFLSSQGADASGQPL
jgi:hypothetical protein